MTDTAQNLLSASSARPQGLPEKFWDAEKQTVRLEELIAAYNELALRDDNLVEGNLRGLPESYEQYDIKIPSPYLERDDEVLKRLYEKSYQRAGSVGLRPRQRTRYSLSGRNDRKF